MKEATFGSCLKYKILKQVFNFPGMQLHLAIGKGRAGLAKYN